MSLNKDQFFFIEFAVFAGIGFITRDLADRFFPPTINLGITRIPTILPVAIIFVVLLFVIGTPVDRAVRTWLINKGWLRNHESS
jgi:hypothetical protein